MYAKDTVDKINAAKNDVAALFPVEDKTYDALLALYLWFEDNWMQGTPDWTYDDVKNSFMKLLKDGGLDKKVMYTTLRVALTGHENGMDIFKVMIALDKATCFERLMRYCTMYYNFG